MRRLLACAAATLIALLPTPAAAQLPLLGAGPGATGPWLPGQQFLASEKGSYYDLADASTVFSDSACTTPATLTGAIGCIKDKSPNHINVIMATGAFQPTWQSSGGLYWMQTNNNNSWLGAAFSAGTFGTMDVSFSGQRTSANTVPINSIDNGGAYLDVASSGSGSTGNVGTGAFINGTAVPGGSGATWGQMYTAWTSGTPVSIDTYGANLSGWTGFGFGDYSTFAALTRVYRMFVHETMTAGNRAGARTWTAAGAGLVQ